MSKKSTPVLNKQVEDRAHCFDIDSYEFLIDIDSLRDRVHWFDIDRLRACVRDDIDSWSSLKHISHDCAYGFGIDRLKACVRVDIDS